MGLVKRTYTDNVTVITAENLNDIQDSIIALEGSEEALGEITIIERNASGSIASFADGADYPVKELIADINAVQDLHGQANPYPAGGGKNLLNPKLYSGGSYNPSVGTVYTFTESAKQFNTSDNRVFTISTTATWEYYTLLLPVTAQKYRTSGTIASTSLGVSMCYLDEDYKVLYSSSDSTASKSIEATWNADTALEGKARFIAITFTNRSTASETITVTAPQAEVGTTTTTYAPYSNICPISGWDGANVCRATDYHRFIPTTSYAVDDIIEEKNGLKLIYKGGGKYRLIGVPTSATTFDYVSINSFVAPTATNRRIRLNNTQARSDMTLNIRYNGTLSEGWSFTAIDRIATYTNLAGKTINAFSISTTAALNGTSIDNTFMVEFVDTDTEKCFPILFPASGKNIFNGIFLQGYHANADGTFTSSNAWITTQKIMCKPSTYYTASSDAKMTRWQSFIWYDADGKYISYSDLNSGANIGLTKQSPSNAHFFAFNIAGYPNSSNTISPSDVTNFQIEEGQTATSYEPHEYAVYGGMLDVTTGVLTVTHGYVDLGTLNWTSVSGNNYANFYTSDLSSLIAYNASSPTLICTNYKAEANNTASASDDKYIWINTQKTVRIKDTSKSSMTASDFKSAMSGVYLVYELATPTTVTLTPTEVKSLLGQNNIFADSGDVDVTYRASASLVIEQLTNAIISLGGNV